MFTHEEIAEVMINRGKAESVSNVKIRGGVIVSHLENQIEPKEPYYLFVSPHKCCQVLCIYVHLLPRIQNRKHINTFLYLAGHCLGLSGSLHMMPGGELAFKLVHLCENYESGPSPDFLMRLIGSCVRDIRTIEQFFLFFEILCKAGSSKEETNLLNATERGEKIISEFDRTVANLKIQDG